MSLLTMYVQPFTPAAPRGTAAGAGEATKALPEGICCGLSTGGLGKKPAASGRAQMSRIVTSRTIFRGLS